MNTARLCNRFGPFHNRMTELLLNGITSFITGFPVTLLDVHAKHIYIINTITLTLFACTQGKKKACAIYTPWQNLLKMRLSTHQL